ncbi:MAG: phosphotransferase family protein [Porticoccaceae bacterium]|jgi:aminoglycoside phosphotransferase (APT) family kinase protein|nr:phosphotransferase family protein [Porticoccaceae bacterium]
MLPTDNDILKSLLEDWLKARMAAPDLRVTAMKDRSGAGFSAETFYIDVAHGEAGNARELSLVVRCQNQSSDFFVAASIDFPYRVMEAVAAHSQVPVPNLIGLEMDDSVLGLPFLVMEKMDGRVVQQSPNYNRAGWLADMTPGQRRQVWLNGIDQMAAVNRLDWQDGFTFLADPKYGQPGIEGYLGWVREWYEWARGEPIPLMERAFERLMSERPENAPVSVLWGDPSPSNILFANDSSGAVTVVLDWELANLGPAEVDLAWWLFFDDLFSHGMGVPRLEGLPNREETIAHYEAKLGRKVAPLDYYDLLATFRMAIVGMRAVDRQIERGTIPRTSNARSHQPIMCLLAQRMGEPVPTPGEDYAAFAKVIGLA